MKTAHIIRRLYPSTFRPTRWRRSMLRFRRWGRDRRVLGIAGSMVLLIVVWAAFHIHYYNRLVALRFDAETAWAQIEVQEQRRFHIQKSLVRIVMDYAAHEREMHQQLTEMRTGVPASRDAEETLPDPASVDEITPEQMAKIFPKMRIVAEQYANLRLTENFQQLSESLINTETMIADAIIRYNVAVNNYTTVLNQFPGNLFGRVGGFESLEFYQPDPDKLGFAPVEY